MSHSVLASVASTAVATAVAVWPTRRGAELAEPAEARLLTRCAVVGARDREGFGRNYEVYREHGSVRVRVVVEVEGEAGLIEVEPRDLVDAQLVSEPSGQRVEVVWRPAGDPVKKSSPAGRRVVEPQPGTVDLEAGSHLELVLEATADLELGRYRLTCASAPAAVMAKGGGRVSVATAEDLVLVVRGIESNADRANYLLHEATRARERGDHIEAIALEAERATVMPADFTPDLFIGGSYRELGDYDNAIVHLERALERAKATESEPSGGASKRMGAASVAQALALVYLLKGEPERAEELIRVLAGIDTDAMWARVRQQAARLAER